MHERKQRPSPKAGTSYVKTYKGRKYTMKVIEVNGELAYSVSGNQYRTPTAAAKSITGNEVNGWTFWKMD